MSTRKTPVKTPAKKTAKKVAKRSAKKRSAKKVAKKAKRKKRPQAHGGALLVGNPGNAGGSGRPPSAIRAVAREHLDKRIPLLGSFAGNRKAKMNDRIRAIEALARIGLEESIAVADVRRALDATGELIRDRLLHEVADKLIDDIRAIWLQL